MTSLLPQGPVIITRYKGPTNHRGSRIVATHKRDTQTTHRVSIPWDHAISAEENHKVAADACLERCQFSIPLVIVARGHDVDGYSWVCAFQEQKSDQNVLDALANALSGSEWNADTLSTVADLIKQTGRTVDDLT